MNWRVTTNSLRPGENAWVSVEIWGNDKTPKHEEIIWDERKTPRIDLSKYRIPANYSIKVIMRYKDLLGNRFGQELQFHVNYMVSYNEDNNPRYHCDIHMGKVEPPVMI